MTEAQLVSHYVLWAIVIILSGLVLVLTRQVGILHDRIAPAGALALSSGPEVGQAAPGVEVRALDGTLYTMGESAGAEAPSRLLFFLSPECPVCLELHPIVRRLAKRYGAQLIFASDGDDLDHEAFVAEHGLDRSRYTVSQMGMSFGIAKLPYAVLMDGEGIVRAQGLVNTREHVESLFEAEEQGVGSIQEFLQQPPASLRVENE